MTRFLSALALLLLAALPARAFVDIQPVTSAGGIDAWLVEDHSQPFVAVEIRFRGGARLDPEGKAGAVSLMTGLIEEGAGEMDSRAFAAARDRLGARFRFDAGRDTVSISARMLTETRGQAADLLNTALTETRFSEPALERVRGQVISIIRQNAQEPNSRAWRRFYETAFEGHPYARPVNGTEESVSALTRDDMTAARDAAIARDRLHVGVAGDITAEELGPFLDRLFAGLPGTGAALPGPAKVHLSGGVTVAPYDTPQSVAAFGHEGIARDDPDFFAAYILNEILGGRGFSSRLMEEVRVRRGLTYGVGTSLVTQDNAALIAGQMASANARMAEAVEVLRGEWRRAAEGGITQDELEAAKKNLIGGYPLRFSGNAAISRILAGMQYEGLGIDYVATRNDRVAAVSLRDVNRVAGELLRPDALSIVIVGRPDGLEPAPPG